jgi:hypothetical protein
VEVVEDDKQKEREGGRRDGIHEKTQYVSEDVGGCDERQAATGRERWCSHSSSVSKDRVE